MDAILVMGKPSEGPQGSKFVSCTLRFNECDPVKVQGLQNTGNIQRERDN